MYVHIGNGVTVKKSHMVGIFDLDTATISQTTRAYLAKAEKAHRVETPESELPKCFLLLSPPKSKRRGKSETKPAETVMLLRISSTRLGARAETNGQASLLEEE